MQTELAVIILNYKTPDLTIDCLASLEGEMDGLTQVLVVDNHSNDGSADKIDAAIRERDYGAWARLIRSPVNGGFAAGNNLGIRAVSADGYVLLNSDTLVKPGAIAGLKRAMREHPEAGIIGPRLVSADGEPDMSAFRQVRPLSELVSTARTGPISTLFRRFEAAMPIPNEPVEVDWLGFACVLIRRQVIDDIGLLDEGYFMYFEDVDYCIRTRKAGYKILYYPGPEVVHLLGGSSGVTTPSHAQRRGPRYYYEARSRFYAKNYGMFGPLLANLAWLGGRGVARARALVDGKQIQAREKEALDIWTNIQKPMRESSASPIGAGTDPHAGPLPRGDRNLNPADIGFVELVLEDFRTHDSDPLSPGFWAIFIHRFGNWRMDLPKPIRAPIGLLYFSAFRAVDLGFDIDLSYTVKLGRRVRIWYHGGIRLGARAIGDDVHIRPNTTMGLLSRDEPTKKPIIEDRVDIGTGACILGAVTVRHDTVIGANSVVVRNFPAHSTLFGVPARPVNLPPRPAEGESSEGPPSSNGQGTVGRT